jgi:hypothetical protein
LTISSPRQWEKHASATTGVRNGDASSLIAMLSKRDPVTLFQRRAAQEWLD